MPARLKVLTPAQLETADTKALVKHYLAVLEVRAPGRSVEVRVPPFAAVQVIPGVRHTRGTPPAVVETDADTWLALARGVVSWAEALDSGAVVASGERTDLSAYLPLGQRVKAVLSSRTLADAVGPVDGIEIEVWNGDGPPPAGDVDLWVPHYATRPDVIDQGHRLKGLQVVQLQSAGYDGVRARLPEGVTLCNASGVHDDATAEHAVGLVLASLRGIPEAVRSHGHWQSDKMRRSLADSRVIVLGYGSIGRALVERLLPMKAVVTAVASRGRDDDLVGRVHGIDELPVLLPEQDVVVALVPLDDATRGLLGDEAMSLLPDGALVVNVARGGVVDTDAVLRHAGRLRFALDVTDPEPLPDGHPLWDAPGVLITPHVAGGTTAMLPRISALVRAQLERRVAGEPLVNVVSG